MLRNLIQCRFHNWVTSREIWYSASRDRVTRTKNIPNMAEWKTVSGSGITFPIPAEWKHTKSDSNGMEQHFIKPQIRYANMDNGLVIISEKNDQNLSEKQLFQLLTKRDNTEGLALDLPSNYVGTFAAFRSVNRNREEEGLIRTQSTPEKYYAAYCLWSVDIPANDPSKDVIGSIINNIELV